LEDGHTGAFSDAPFLLLYRHHGRIDALGRVIVGESAGKLEVGGRVRAGTTAALLAFLFCAMCNVQCAVCKTFTKDDLAELQRGIGFQLVQN
jgi:hypothetical protein